MSTFTFKTFEQWKKDNSELLEDDEYDCPNCDGEGNHECDCGDTHECLYCDGTGKLFDGAPMENLYRKQLKKDRELLERLTGALKQEQS